MRTACFVFMFFVAAAIAAPAQTFTNLFYFDGSNGAHPQTAPLVQGIDGNFYGTTGGGGLYGEGTVFKITPGGALTALYNFTGGEDGSGPMPGLVLATNGDFYGLNSNGGSLGYGTVFKITAEGALTTLLSFNSGDGDYPGATLIQATNGNFYGTNGGGANGYGRSSKSPQVAC